MKNSITLHSIIDHMRIFLNKCSTLYNIVNTVDCSKHLIYIYIIVYIFYISSTDLFLYLGDPHLFFSTPDSKGYKLLADSIILHISDTIPSNSLIGLRPMLYPIYLSLYEITSIYFVQLLQLVMNVISIVVLYKTIRLVLKTNIIPLLFVIILLLTPTFTFISLHALTETITILLTSIYLLLITKYFVGKKIGYLVIGIIILSALSCIKGIYIPILIINTLLIIFSKLPYKIKTCSIIFVLILPISQIYFSYHWTNKPTISTAGEVNLNIRFLPAVYANVNYNKVFVGYNDDIAKESLVYFKNKSMIEKLYFMVKHYDKTYETYIFILKNMQLITSSSFIGYPLLSKSQKEEELVNWMRNLSKNINLYLYYLYFIMFILSLFLIKKKIAHSYIIYLYAFLGSLILPTPLVYWQGDRMILIAFPVLIVLYGVMSGLLISNVKNLRSSIIKRQPGDSSIQSLKQVNQHGGTKAPKGSSTKRVRLD